jgi:multidrug resistance efflux pump
VLAGAYFWFGSNPKELRLPGVVEIQDVRLGSKVTGRVAEILVREGDRVEADTPLVRLALPELQAQRDQLVAKLAAAQADRDKMYAGARPLEKESARAAYVNAEKKLVQTTEGWRDEEKRQAKADLDAAVADAIQANREYIRLEMLLPGGGATAAEMDVARGNRDRANARQSSSKIRYEMLNKGGWDVQIAAAAADRDRLKAQYDLLLEGNREEDKRNADAQVALLKAQIREMDAQLSEGTITAAERCVIEVLSVRKGDLVTANVPVIRVLRAEDLWVRIYVPEPDLGKVRLGQPARVTLDAYPGTTFDGEVIQIDTISEFTPRNVQSADQRKHQVFAVKVHVPDPRGIFKSGLAAEVVLPLHGADQ